MQHLTRPEGCLSDLVLDELFADELEAGIRASAQMHIASCERCTARHAELSATRVAFISHAPTFKALAQVVVPKLPTLPIRLARWQLAAGALAMAAGVLLCLRASSDPAALVDTRSKGAPHLGLFIERAGQAQRRASGTIVQPGDLLRFTYSSDQPRYLAIFDLDGSNARVSFPRDGRADAAAIAAGNDVALDFSVEQNESAEPEHVHALFCMKPFALAPLREELARAGKLTEQSGCAIDVIELPKAKAAR
jgi:hypothetical protein